MLRTFCIAVCFSISCGSKVAKSQLGVPVRAAAHLAESWPLESVHHDSAGERQFQIFLDACKDVLEDRVKHRHLCHGN